MRGSVPDEVLDFMLDASLASIEKMESLRNPNSIQDYIKTACAHFNLPVEKVISKSRKRELVEARHFIAVMLLRKGYSLKMVAESLGARHHSTVIHARETVNDLCFSDEDFRSRKERFFNYINEYAN